MIKTVLLESKAGVHKCEVASGLEKYLPCPWPGCKYGVNHDYLKTLVPDDFVYAFSSKPDITNPPHGKSEVFSRRQTKDLKWQWYFEREE